MFQSRVHVPCIIKLEELAVNTTLSLDRSLSDVDHNNSHLDSLNCIFNFILKLTNSTYVYGNNTAIIFMIKNWRPETLLLEKSDN